MIHSETERLLIEGLNGLIVNNWAQYVTQAETWLKRHLFLWRTVTKYRTWCLPTALHRDLMDGSGGIIDHVQHALIRDFIYSCGNITDYVLSRIVAGQPPPWLATYDEQRGIFHACFRKQPQMV
jgi:hypothetical protein